MKRKNILFGTLAVAAVTVGMIGCKKGITPADKSHSLTAGVTATCDCSINPATGGDSLISGQITTDLTLSNTKVYQLSGLVFVTGNHVLTIEPGARIEGLKGTGGNVGGGLIITRGSRLEAVGTPSCPIVFTSAEANPQSGDWSGVILLGNAPTNNYPAFVEGINNTSYPNIDLVYGNSTPVPNDNSGTLKFVRIEYGGYALSLNNEINGLTLAGVGSGTTIDYVEVFKANDDAFEFFGGTVNASHIIAVDALDDMFDTDNGYSGTISYALGMSDVNRPDQSQSNGLESDNDGTGSTNQPFTNPSYNHLTIIGVPSATTASTTTGGPSGTGKYGRAAHLRRGARFHIDNAIFMGFNYGVSLDGQLGNPTTPDAYFADISSITNSFSAAFGTAATPGVGPYSQESNGTAATGAGFSSSDAFLLKARNAGNTDYLSSNANIIGLVDPFNRGGGNGAANFIPDPVTSDAVDAGAFPGGTDWTNVDGCWNWTRYQ